MKLRNMVVGSNPAMLIKFGAHKTMNRSDNYGTEFFDNAKKAIRKHNKDIYKQERKQY
jgi:hypothetical protein